MTRFYRSIMSVFFNADQLSCLQPELQEQQLKHLNVHAFDSL